MHPDDCRHYICTGCAHDICTDTHPSPRQDEDICAECAT